MDALPPLNLDIANTNMINPDVHTGASVGSLPGPPALSGAGLPAWVLPAGLGLAFVTVVALIWKAVD